MKSQTGAELSCRGHNYNLPVGDHTLPRGVVSYYASATLASARTLSDWQARIETLVQRDVQAGKLPPLYEPELQVLGDGDQPVDAQRHADDVDFDSIYR